MRTTSDWVKSSPSSLTRRFTSSVGSAGTIGLGSSASEAASSGAAGDAWAAWAAWAEAGAAAEGADRRSEGSGSNIAFMFTFIPYGLKAGFTSSSSTARSDSLLSLRRRWWGGAPSLLSRLIFARLPLGSGEEASDSEVGRRAPALGAAAEAEAQAAAGIRSSTRPSSSSSSMRNEEDRGRSVRKGVLSLEAAVELWDMVPSAHRVEVVEEARFCCTTTCSSSGTHSPPLWIRSYLRKARTSAMRSMRPPSVGSSSAGAGLGLSPGEARPVTFLVQARKRCRPIIFSFFSKRSAITSADSSCQGGPAPPSPRSHLSTARLRASAMVSSSCLSSPPVRHSSE
mmetsp:Transcript_34161/g.74702  ORF Transcript_34161/g.74702 Transcript_34161/m.74702 type:complete len:341 (+) Transcript_34161:932-1954(+)